MNIKMFLLISLLALVVACIPEPTPSTTSTTLGTISVPVPTITVPATLNFADGMPPDWGDGPFSGEFQRYFDSQVTRTANGVVLTAEDARSENQGYTIRSGAVTYGWGISDETITIGSSVEAEVKFPAIAGTFAAFWLMPTEQPQPWLPEIDVAEAVGVSAMNSIFWTGNADGSNAVEDKVVTVNDGQWHSWRIELDVTESRIYRDDILVNTGVAYPGVEWGLIFNLAWGRGGGTPAYQLLPQSMEVRNVVIN